MKIIGLNETSLNETNNNSTDETSLNDDASVSTVVGNQYAIEIESTYDVNEVHMNAPSMYGGVVIEFAFDMEFPIGIEQWSSENVGAFYIEITY